MHYRVTIREQVTIPAPAKLNLGLEVLGRRPDGYHEILTILQTIDLCDHLELEPASQLIYQTSVPDDLVARALRALELHNVTLRARIRLEKRIPLSSGLGGGSSDAGTLLGALWHAGLPEERVRSIAETLGSDVPFFLLGGTALARGRGTEIEPLPSVDGWFVVVVPEVSLPSKTPRLYAALTPSDYSDGSATLHQAERLRAHLGFDPSLVRNAFLRPLLTFEPVRQVVEHFRSAGIAWVWPSGAGPAIFTWSPSRAEAETIATALRTRGLHPYLTHPFTPDWESIATAIDVTVGAP